MDSLIYLTLTVALSKCIILVLEKYIWVWEMSGYPELRVWPRNPKRMPCLRHHNLAIKWATKKKAKPFWTAGDTLSRDGNAEAGNLRQITLEQTFIPCIKFFYFMHLFLTLTTKFDYIIHKRLHITHSLKHGGQQDSPNLLKNVLTNCSSSQ